MGSLIRAAGIAALAAVMGCGGDVPRGPVGINSITPDHGDIAGGTTVTIKGWGFADPATVTFDGTPATSITVVDASNITCDTPAGGAGGWAEVSVTIDTDTATRTNGFYYYIPPTVTLVNPAEGPSSGYTDVTITGTGFLAGAAVTFGGVDATEILIPSSMQLICKTPEYPAGGAVDVTVTNTDTGSVTLTSGYTYRLPPDMTSVTPSYADVTGGTLITITGTEFYGDTSNTLVKVGTTDVTPDSVIATQVTFTVPAGLDTGTYTVTVINPDSQSDTLILALDLYDAAETIFIHGGTGDDGTGDGSLGTPYATIGKGISAAAAGKTVFVLDGTYTTGNFPSGTFPLDMKAGVTVIGAGTADVIIDAGGTPNAVVSFNALSGLATSLKRLTVTGGHAATGTGIVAGNSDTIELIGLDIYGQSRGVEMSSSEVSIHACNIHNNLSRGGLTVLSSDITVTDTVFADNTQEDASSVGAGAYVDSLSTLQFEDCLFEGNDATSGSTAMPGGGIYICGTGNIIHCIFVGNSASFGGGLLTYDILADIGGDPQLIIENCIFYDNTAVNTSFNTDGSAVAVVSSFFQNNTGTELRNCVFADNISGDTGSTILGYSEVIINLCHPIIRNCIITGSNANGYYGNTFRAAPKLAYNCFWDNALNHVNVSTFAVNTESGINSLMSGSPLEQNEGNIVRDTSFKDAASNDYHLDAGSNCIDAGDPDAAYDDTDATRNDMGAYGGPNGDWP